MFLPLLDYVSNFSWRMENQTLLLWSVGINEIVTCAFLKVQGYLFKDVRKKHFVDTSPDTLAVHSCSALLLLTVSAWFTLHGEIYHKYNNESIEGKRHVQKSVPLNLLTKLPPSYRDQYAKKRDEIRLVWMPKYVTMIRDSSLYAVLIMDKEKSWMWNVNKSLGRSPPPHGVTMGML